MATQRTIISGGDDFCLRFEGRIQDEFFVPEDDKARVLTCSDGTAIIVKNITHWSLKVQKKGTAFLSRNPAPDTSKGEIGDGCAPADTDNVTMGPIDWVRLDCLGETSQRAYADDTKGAGAKWASLLSECDDDDDYEAAEAAMKEYETATA